VGGTGLGQTICKRAVEGRRDEFVETRSTAATDPDATVSASVPSITARARVKESIGYLQEGDIPVSCTVSVYLR
jgi:hypothetical protein